MQSDTANFQEILSGPKCFVIPPFQRPYKWGKDNRNELWYDILTQYEKFTEVNNQNNSNTKLKSIPTHYMGTLVFAGPSNLKGVASSDVIDGQQRLTTLITLLAAIRDRKINYIPTKADDVEIEEEVSAKKKTKKVSSENSEKKEFDKFNDVYFINSLAKDLHYRYRIRLQSEDSAALQAVILKKKPGPISNSEKTMVYDSYKQFYKFINMDKDDVKSDEKLKRFEHLFPLDLESLQEVVLTRLTFIQIETANADDVNSIFESLNAKSEPLDQIELIKNYYYMLLGDNANQEMTKYWGRVKASIHKDSDQEQFIWSYYVSRGSYAMQNKVYNLVKSELINSGARDNPEKMCQHLETIVEWAPVFAELKQIEESNKFDGFSNFNRPEADAISRVYSAGGSTCTPIFLWLSQLKKDGKIDDGILIKCVGLLESYIVRRFLCGRPPNNLNLSNGKMLKYLAALRLKNGEVFLALEEALKNADLEWPTDEKLKELIRSEPFYTNGKAYQRFFVLGEIDRSLDSRTRKDYSESENSIEHIIPQSAPNDNDWRNYLRAVSNIDAFLENNLDVLGNLTIVRNDENSKLGSKLLDLKLPIYDVSEYALTRRSATWIRDNLQDYKFFGEEALKARSDWLSDIICKRWPR